MKHLPSNRAWQPCSGQLTLDGRQTVETHLQKVDNYQPAQLKPKETPRAGPLLATELLKQGRPLEAFKDQQETVLSTQADLGMAGVPGSIIC